MFIQIFFIPLCHTDILKTVHLKDGNFQKQFILKSRHLYGELSVADDKAIPSNLLNIIKPTEWY